MLESINTSSYKVKLHARNNDHTMRSVIQMHKSITCPKSGKQLKITSKVAPYTGAFSPLTVISNGIVLVFSVLGSMKPSAGPSGSPVWTTNPSAAQNIILKK